MTAEIAILNREAVALAADSAVTYQDPQGRKIFPSANKIFSLSKFHPVGVMIYGNASFMGVPWETVVKEYRRQLGRQSFDHLEEYVEDFLQFLRETPAFANPNVQSEYVQKKILQSFISIRSEIEAVIKALLDVHEQVDDEDVKRVVKVLVKRHLDEWRTVAAPPGAPADFVDQVRKGFDREIDGLRKAVFEKLLTPVTSRWLGDIAAHEIAKFPAHRVDAGTSGVVVAGFGQAEMFPSLHAFYLDAIVMDRLKHRSQPGAKVDASLTALVKPFAQSEMVYMFMEGIDPDLERELETMLRKVLTEYPEQLIQELDGLEESEKGQLTETLRKLGTGLFRKYRKEIRRFRSEQYAQPIVRVMSILPKEELAAAAESLVNITSVKRRFSTQVETVGGPTDVAVISKGDGFVWIKRKHYFPAELNPQFLPRYFEDAYHGREPEEV